MRHPRIRPVEDSFMHVHNRTAGCAGEFPFDAAEKEAFMRRIKRLATLYVIEPLAVQVMGNHYHLMLYIPGEPPTNEETLGRFTRYYGSSRHGCRAFMIGSIVVMLPAMHATI